MKTLPAEIRRRPPGLMKHIKLQGIARHWEKIPFGSNYKCIDWQITQTTAERDRDTARSAGQFILWQILEPREARPWLYGRYSFINCVVIECHRDKGRLVWISKNIPEIHGPTHFTCPPDMVRACADPRTEFSTWFRQPLELRTPADLAGFKVLYKMGGR